MTLIANVMYFKLDIYNLNNIISLSIDKSLVNMILVINWKYEII